MARRWIALNNRRYTDVTENPQRSVQICVQLSFKQQAGYLQSQCNLLELSG